MSAGVNAEDIAMEHAIDQRTDRARQSVAADRATPLRDVLYLSGWTVVLPHQAETPTPGAC